MIESLIKGYSNKDNNEFNDYVASLDLKGLVNLYLKCSSRLYFQRYNNSINDILMLIYQNINSKLKETPLIEVMDIYCNIFNEFSHANDSVEASKNIIQVRKYNLTDDFFIDYEARRNKITREEFIERYSQKLEFFEEDYLFSKAVFDYVDNLQNTMLEYIEKTMTNLTETERLIYLAKINEIIEETSLEIIRRNDMRKNRRAIDIQSKMQDISTFEIFSMLDTTNLENKNNVYNSFKNNLKEKGMNK